MGSTKQLVQPAQVAAVSKKFTGFRVSRLAAALAVGLAAWGSSQAAQSDDWVQGRLLVMPNAGLSEAALARVLAPHGGRSSRVGKSNLRIVDLPAGQAETVVLEAMSRHPHIKFAELDRKVSLSLAANDPYLGSEWHLAKINAGVSWDIAQGSGVTIAIIDTGVSPTHPDLASKLVPGWNFYDGNSNTADVNSHGTSVAGTSAALVNNGVGVAGVAGAARIMPLRVADAAGSSSYSKIAQAITYAADNGARVANASFAGLFKSSSVISAAQYMKSKGGLVTVAAGNAGIDENSPATSAMIPVAATDSADARASWSSYGGMVAVAAPGVGIWTTKWDGTYWAESGTSFASPVTAGVLALMMSAQPSLPNTQIESLLYSTAVDLGAAGRDIYFGYGRVDAAAAVAAAAKAAAQDTQAPTVAIASPTGGSTATGVVAIGVNASDNVGVSRVELRVNGTLLGTDVASPYQFSWDTLSVANGSFSLVATAVDSAGNSTASTAVTVNVANGVVADTAPPVVAILKPANGSAVSGTVSVGLSATDNSGAATLQQSLYLDGKLVASATGGSLSYSWNTRKAASGTHTLQAVAKDSAGNTATTSIQVTR